MWFQMGSQGDIWKDGEGMTPNSMQLHFYYRSSSDIRAANREWVYKCNKILLQKLFIDVN